MGVRGGALQGVAEGQMVGTSTCGGLFYLLFRGKFHVA